MSFRRIATVGLAAGSALAAVTALAVSASGSSAAPAAPAKMGGHVMVFKSVVAQESDVDNGKKGFSVGDTFTFSDDLYKWGSKKKVGTDGGTCTVTWLKGEEGAVQCVATLALKGGQVTVQGISAGAEDEPFTVAVTGGTGMYRGATGTLTVDNQSEDVDKLTLRLDRGAWSDHMGADWAPWNGDDGGTGGKAG